MIKIFLGYALLFMMGAGLMLGIGMFVLQQRCAALEYTSWDQCVQDFRTGKIR